MHYAAAHEMLLLIMSNSRSQKWVNSEAYLFLSAQHAAQHAAQHVTDPHKFRKRIWLYTLIKENS